MARVPQDAKVFWAAQVALGLQAHQVSKVIQVTREHQALLVRLVHQVFAVQTAVLAIEVRLDYQETLAAVALQETPVLLDRWDLRDRRDRLDLLEQLETLDKLDLLACKVIYVCCAEQNYLCAVNLFYIEII